MFGKLKNFILIFNKNIKFNFNLILFIIKPVFQKFLANIFIIFNEKKKIICFLLFLPITYYLVKIQIYVVIFFVLWYLILFIIFYKLLKSQLTISCEEAPLNTSNLSNYVILNTFIFIPKAKAFIIVYNFLFFIFKKKEKLNFSIFFILSLVFLVIYVFKISLILITGYTFLSISVTSDFVINLFNTLTWNYESKKAKYQHILINCFLNNKDTVGKADEMKIIINNGDVFFNMIQKFYQLFSKFKNLELLGNNYLDIKDNIYVGNINNHYNCLVESTKYPDFNISKNVTSSLFVNSLDENGIISKIECRDGFWPNIKGQNKGNFLSPSYLLDKKSSIVKELQSGQNIKLSTFLNRAYLSIIFDKDQKMTFFKDGKLHSDSNTPSVKEFCYDSKIPVTDSIKKIEEFEKVNSEVLNTKEGREAYNVIKKIMFGFEMVDDGK